MRLLLKDARGHPSWTASLIVPAFLGCLAKFMVAGLSFPIVGAVPSMSGTEFAATAVALLGVWVAREVTDKPLDAKNGT